MRKIVRCTKCSGTGVERTIKKGGSFYDLSRVTMNKCPNCKGTGLKSIEYK